jgi:hypothetical protein
VQTAWSDNLLARWNMAISAAGNEIRGAHADSDALGSLWEANGVSLEVKPVLLFMARYLFGRSLTSDECDILLAFADSTPGDDGDKIAAGIALLLASPAFQYK